MTPIRHNGSESGTGSGSGSGIGSGKDTSGGAGSGAAGASAAGSASPPGDPVLDAVRDCVLAVGVRRTTLTDVARRAGVSRMTLYRRWPDVRSLVGDLMTREWIGVATGAMPEPRPGTATRTLIVDGLVAGVAAFRAHPLFRKIVDVDPELLLPYVLDRRGASQDALLELVTDALREGHADGSVRPGHPARQARSLLLVVQSFTLSLRTMTDEDDPELSAQAFLGELRTLLERTLTP